VNRTRTPRTSRPTSRRLAFCAAAVVGVLGIAGSGSASAADDGQTDTTRDEMIVIDDGVVVGGDGVAIPEDGLIDIMPIDPAAANAEQDALADYLAAHGIAFEVVTDGEFHWVEIDWEDPAAQAAMEDFYWERYPTPQEVIDQVNADNEALAQYLRDHGIEVTVTTDRHGMTMVEWDWEDPAAQLAVEDYYWNLYPMPQEVIDQINADAEALAEFLRAKGFDATVTFDRHGVATTEFDWEDPAVQEALAEYWSEFAVPMPGLDGDVVVFDGPAAPFGGDVAMGGVGITFAVATPAVAGPAVAGPAELAG